MERNKSEHEEKLHSVMQHHDVGEGAAKGGLLGAAAGRALAHGSKHTALATAAGGLLGLGTGSLVGRVKGKERTLRDTVAQERIHDRAEARMKKAEMQGFDDRLKQADVYTQLGQGIMSTGMRAARAISPSMESKARSLVGRGVAAVGGTGIEGRMNLAKRVGQGAAALGAGTAAAGAGYAAGKSR